MYQQLSNYFIERVFDCTRCQQSLMNPYLHTNPKHDPPEGLWTNRRKFQLDYIASKWDIRLVIVGEAPGLDGCGFGGIAFTGEHNAVVDLGLPNHHGTKVKLQKEQSANLIYGALAAYCDSTGTDLALAARRIYLTNAIMCVPLGKNGKSITTPNADTKKQCRDCLIRQLELIRPRAVITLGANALGAVAEAFNLTIDGKLTDLVSLQRESKITFMGPNFTIIPEIHPSPRNRVLGDLYLGLSPRLVDLFTLYLN